MPLTGEIRYSPVFYSAYVCVRDKKASTTNGGTFTSGAWRTRDLNEEQADAAGIASIATNQITLAAGTYRCIISSAANLVARHQLRLQNITDTATLLVGHTAYVHVATVVTGFAHLRGRFTIAAEKVLEVQHRSDATHLNTGFGGPCNFTDEIYTIAEFWREV